MKFAEPEAVAFPARFAGTILVKEPARILPVLIWTTRDVRGTCVEIPGMNKGEDAPVVVAGL